jgi:WD40 repeat protein
MTASTGDVPGRIFMSYRRDETAGYAGWLFDRLASHFGRDQVFKDIDSIELGDDFADVINTAVGSCHVLLALIGHRWLTITDRNGRPRLDDPDDFVRQEIEAALVRNVRVIPILVDGARMPRADELPASLAKLARRQGLELNPSRFDADTRKLLRALERAIDEAQEQARRAAEQAAAQRRQVEQLQGQIRNRAATQDWDAVVAASDELAALDPAAADPDGLASAARDQITRRQQAEQAAAQRRQQVEQMQGQIGERPDREVEASALRETKKWAPGDRSDSDWDQRDKREEAAAHSEESPHSMPFKVQHPTMSAGTADEDVYSRGGKSQAARIQRRRAAVVGVASILVIAAVAVGFTLINDMGRDTTLRIAPRLVRTFQGPDPGYSGDVAYSPDGKMLVTANANGSTYLWNLSTGHRIATLTEPPYDGGKTKYQDYVAYSPGGKALAVAFGSTTYVWDIVAKRIIDRLSVPNCPFGTNIAYGPNGTTLVTACGRYNDVAADVGSAAGNTYLWDIATKHIIATFSAPQSLGVLSLAYSPRGTTLVTADYGNEKSNNDVEGKTYLWEIATRRIIATLTDPHSPLSSAAVAYSHNNKVVATSDQNGNTDLWDVATGREIITLSNPHCQNQDVSVIEFSPDDTTLATVCGAGNVVNLWDVATRHIVTTFTDPQSQGVATVAYSPTGTSLAAADINGNTYVWTGVSR